MSLFDLFGGGKEEESKKEVARSVKLVKQAGPATTLDKVEKAGGISLRKKAEAVGASLQKAGLQGIRAQVVLVLDHSGSMYNDYAHGQVQELTERFLAFGLQVDADGEIPVIPFDSRTYATVKVSLENYQDIVNKQIWKRASMGSTNLASALEEVVRLAKTTDAPIFCGVVTDGSPDSKPETTRIVCELANYPVFLKFLALRDVPYLRDLDSLDDSKRLIDNVNSQTFGSLNITDQKFAESVTEEWDDWVTKAIKVGILN